MYRFTAALLVVLLLTGPAVVAQQPSDEASNRGADVAAATDLLEGRRPVAMMLAAEGRRVTVFRGSEAAGFDPRTESGAGSPVLPGAYLELDENTTAELQLLPGRTRVKLGSAAALEMREVDATGGGRVELHFGRLRAAVPSTAGALEVSGPEAEVTVFPGSDVAVDVLVDRETAETFTAATVIGGRASMTLRAAGDRDAGDEGSAKDGVALEAREAARTGVADGVPRVETAEPGDRGTLEFWGQRRFIVSPKDAEELMDRYPGAFGYVFGYYEEPEEPEPEEQREAEEPREPEEPREAEVEPDEEPDPEEVGRTAAEVPEEEAESDRAELRNGGIGLMGMGVFFAAAGFGVDYAAESFPSAGPPAGGVSPGEVLMYSGGAFFAGGLVSLIVSLF
ncbi:MAG: hypothetical protein ACLFSP_00525 [Spirochaetaceae bacterium]